MKKIQKYSNFNENVISYNHLPISTIIEKLQTIYEYEGEGSIKVKMNESNEIKYFELTITKFNPRVPNSAYTNVGRALKTLEGYGLLYTNMNFCIMFHLIDHKLYPEKHYTSAVGGYKYKYDDINKIFEHFKEAYITLPKPIELKIGDFIEEVRNNNIHRIAYVGYSSYTIFDIATQAGVNYGMPESLDKSEITDDTNTKYKVLSKEQVENKIDYIDKEEMLKDILKCNLSISGIKKGEEENYWNRIEVSGLIQSYNRHVNDKYHLYRVFLNNKKIYDPMGDFILSGHTKVKFDK